jgi:osomolarity two-component system sensor histidine kinase SLN1
VATRILIQNALQRYNVQGNNTVANWQRAIADLSTALNGASSLGILMQAKIFARNDTGTGNNTVVEATGQDLMGQVRLPWSYPDGSSVFLGDYQDTALSYPPGLYPNLTYREVPVNESFSHYYAFYDGLVLDWTAQLFIGPWAVNDSYALASLTLPVINNTSADDILAWMTIVVDARLVTDPIVAEEGLDTTGISMLVGPANTTNRLPNGVLNASSNAPKHLQVRYIIPPNNTLHRHDPAEADSSSFTFDYSKYPVVKDAWTEPSNRENGAEAILSTHNENHMSVGVGYAQIPADGVVDWLLLVEQAHAEVYEPITHLRNVLLACVFGTAGLVALMVLPIAHFGTAPIRRLRDATRNSVAPPGYLDDSDRLVSPDASPEDAQLARKEGFFSVISRWRHSDSHRSSTKEDERRRRQFKIPAKVKDRKHYIHDELTDLTKTFNEMSDELMVNYERLEERVQQRTAELEESKQAAEAANEAKTLFVANISHELKTPLNGILGIAQTSQVETSLAVLKRDMRIIYNQGDLLTKLIQDLLLFSKNQVDHQIGLDESEFRVRDITTQVFSTFQLQAQDNGINLALEYEGPNDAPTAESSGVGDRKVFGPFGTGRVKDMVLWGDKTRLLQVVNNLTSNALKFTPLGGTVRVIVRCIGDEGSSHDISRKGSVKSKQNSISKASLSKQNSGRNSRNLIHYPSGVTEKSIDTPLGSNKINTANEINALDRHSPHKDRTSSPPLGSHEMIFEWEVQDTGPGMSVHVQEKVFEPFFQGDMALSKKFQGTGLGLSICAQLAKLMGGSMALMSEEGKGSTFTLRIPLKQIGSRAESTASSQATNSIHYNSPRNSISGDIMVPDGMRISDGIGPLDTRSTRSLSQSSRREGSSHGKSHANASSPAATKTPATDMLAVGIDPRPSPESPGVEARSLKVLVAEDNKTNQIVVTRLLKMEKINNVTIAEDGDIAQNMVMESMSHGDNYDLIFMDVQVSA